MMIKLSKSIMKWFILSKLGKLFLKAMNIKLLISVRNKVIAERELYEIIDEYISNSKVKISNFKMYLNTFGITINDMINIRDIKILVKKKKYTVIFPKSIKFNNKKERKYIESELIKYYWGYNKNE